MCADFSHPYTSEGGSLTIVKNTKYDAFNVSGPHTFLLKEQIKALHPRVRCYGKGESFFWSVPGESEDALRALLADYEASPESKIKPKPRNKVPTNAASKCPIDVAPGRRIYVDGLEFLATEVQDGCLEAALAADASQTIRLALKYVVVETPESLSELQGKFLEPTL